MNRRIALAISSALLSGGVVIPTFVYQSNYRPLLNEFLELRGGILQVDPGVHSSLANVDDANRHYLATGEIGPLEAAMRQFEAASEPGKLKSEKIEQVMRKMDVVGPACRWWFAVGAVLILAGVALGTTRALLLRRRNALVVGVLVCAVMGAVGGATYQHLAPRADGLPVTDELGGSAVMGVVAAIVIILMTKPAPPTWRPRTARKHQSRSESAAGNTAEGGPTPGSDLPRGR
jgi:hypothetical protein